MRSYNDFLVEFQVNYKYRNTAPQIILPFFLQINSVFLKSFGPFFHLHYVAVLNKTTAAVELISLHSLKMHQEIYVLSRTITWQTAEVWFYYYGLVVTI